MLSPVFTSLCFIVIFIGVKDVSCKNSASVYRIIPRTSKQLDVLFELDGKLENISFWSHPKRVNETVDLLVHQNGNEAFTKLMRVNSLQYQVKVPDVERFLNDTEKIDLKSKVHRLPYSLYYSLFWMQKTFGWTRFHTLDEIYDWLDGLQKKFPKNVQVIVAGVSTENRPIKGVHLKFSENKKAVFIEGGIHAREWLSHSTSTYLINKLLTSERPDIRQLAASYEWYIFPSVNPDGYVYTHIQPTSMNYRLWRKNRSKSSSLSCYQGFCGYCNGVDLNRNWDFYWGGKPGTFHDTCSEIYPGTSAFSESETKSLSKYINGIAPNLFAYISFHSYSQKLIFPYGHTINRVNNYDEQYSVALDAVKALSKRHQTQYEVGSIGELMGEATGSSLDWLKNKYNIPFAYCYELRGQTSSGRFYGFVAPPSEIIPVAEEVMDSLLALFLSATKRKRYSQS